MANTYENTHRTVELHDGAEHAHLAAEQARGKQDHLTGTEQSRRAHEHTEGSHSNGQVTTTGHGIAAFSHEETAALAHKLWEQRGCPAGSPDEDWFQAVKQLRNKSI